MMNKESAMDIKNKNGFSKREWVKFVNCLSGAKSVNLIGTVSSDGNTNLSIVSSVFHLGADPPLMGFVLRPHSVDSPRHTLLNILDTKSFTINHVNQDIFKQAHQTSARYDRNVSEFDMCRLTAEYKDEFKPPYVLESHVKIGLSLESKIFIPQNNTNIIIGKINSVYMDEKYIRPDGSIDISSLDTLAVSGLDEYHQLKPIARLSYAKPNRSVEEI